MMAEQTSSESGLDRFMDDPTSLFYMSAGPFLAIVMGMALIPLRGATTASNFTFAFLALTIAVARLGGRGAAVVTALCSALSLDFFLTEPYRRLSIADKHDVIAFVGLATCGLIAAVLGRPRGDKWDDLIRSIVRTYDPDGPIEPQLASVLRATRNALPLGGLTVRDARNAVVASATPADASRPVPDAVLVDGTLEPPRLPVEGGRMPLVVRGRRLGWLDVWGSAVHASAESRRVLRDVARLVAILLAAHRRDEQPAD